MLKKIFRTKSLSSIIEGAKVNNLVRNLTYFDLIMLGIGAIIGTGIFVITGISAAKYSGPAISLSFLLAGITCMFVAFAYAEVSTMIPSSGSVYTYSYVACGEFVAWCAACLMALEYIVSAATVATGWSGYMLGLLKSVNIEIPAYLTKTPTDGGLINLPSVLITLCMTSLLVKGTKESTNLNNILVFVKIIAILIFLVTGFCYFDKNNLGSNLAEFMPNGFQGIAAGGAAVFIAFIGFDAAATAAEECKNPEKDVTIGIIGSLLICTLLYMLVSGVLVGIEDYRNLDNSAPIVNALKKHGSNFISSVIGVGAIAAMTSVLMLNIYSQSRVLYAISRDGLLPSHFSKIHEKYLTPYLGVIYIGLAISLLTGFVPLNILASVGSMGALLVFALACVIVLILRVKLPEARRPFKCPAVYLVAPSAIISSIYLFGQLFFEKNLEISTNGKILSGWILFCMVTYFVYPFRKSKMNEELVSN